MIENNIQIINPFLNILFTAALKQLRSKYISINSLIFSLLFLLLYVKIFSLFLENIALITKKIKKMKPTIACNPKNKKEFIHLK